MIANKPQGLTKIFREYVAWLDDYRARRDGSDIVLSEDEENG